MKNRINDIYSLIKKNHNVKVKDLAKTYNVTEKTIRLNLQQLEDSGLIIRTHGGATLSTHQSTFAVIVSFHSNQNMLNCSEQSNSPNNKR